MKLAQSVFALCTLKKPVQWSVHKVKHIFLVCFTKKDLALSHDFNELLISKIMDPLKNTSLSTLKRPEQLTEWLMEED